MAEVSEDAAGSGPPAADEDELEFVDHTYRLISLRRIQADEDDDDTDIFEAAFQVDGPNANAEVEIIVSDFEDEAHVLGIALDSLHRAMTAWGRITENRRIAARDFDAVKGG